MSLLADEFLQAAAAGAGLSPEISMGVTHTAHLIQRAQRFALSDDVRAACVGIITSKPSSLLDAAKFARLPFPVTWMEWTPPQSGAMSPGHFPVARVGAILRQEGEAIRMFNCWRHREVVDPDIDDVIARIADPRSRRFGELSKRLGVSALEAAWDIGELDGRPSLNVDSLTVRGWFRMRLASDEGLEGLRRLRNANPNTIRHALHDPAEFKALQKIEHCVAFRINREAMGERTIQEAARTGNIDALRRDLEDDLGPLLAVLILLNSRNCVEIAKVEPPPKLNRARAKRGHPEFVGYSTVDIKLGKADARYAAGGEADHAAVRRHVVRGHFKLRKGGVFWWRPHIRGAEADGVIVRRGYKVEAP